MNRLTASPFAIESLPRTARGVHVRHEEGAVERVAEPGSVHDWTTTPDEDRGSEAVRSSFQLRGLEGGLCVERLNERERENDPKVRCDSHVDIL